MFNTLAESPTSQSPQQWLFAMCDFGWALNDAFNLSHN